MSATSPAALLALWEECRKFISGVRLGGIYADKPGYHNSANANLSRWPGNYSVRVPLDLVNFWRDYARAIDLTMSTANMKLYCGRLQTAVLRGDPRLRGLREWIGTVDGKKVICYIKDDEDGPWRVDWSRDSSHLWHIHLSFFTATCNDTAAVMGVASVMRGESLEQWAEGYEMILGLRKGDRGDRVKYLQALGKSAGYGSYLGPAGVDGIYGDGTSAMVLAMRKAVGSTATSGDEVSYNAAEQIYRVYTMYWARQSVSQAIDAEINAKVAAAVAEAVKKLPAHHHATGPAIPD